MKERCGVGKREFYFGDMQEDTCRIQTFSFLFFLCNNLLLSNTTIFLFFYFHF